MVEGAGRDKQKSKAVPLWAVGRGGRQLGLWLS